MGNAMQNMSEEELAKLEKEKSLFTIDVKGNAHRLEVNAKDNADLLFACKGISDAITELREHAKTSDKASIILTALQIALN